MQRIFDTLTDENFELFAAKHYDNPACVDVDEFRSDLARFKYLKRLLRKYQSTGILQERLILNHIIILYNVFGIEATTKMMWFRIEEEHWPVLKAFLIYLNYMKPQAKVEISLDHKVVTALRNL